MDIYIEFIDELPAFQENDSSQQKDIGDEFGATYERVKRSFDANPIIKKLSFEKDRNQEVTDFKVLLATTLQYAIDHGVTFDEVAETLSFTAQNAKERANSVRAARERLRNLTAALRASYSI